MTGRVLNSAGRPVAGAKVHLRTPQRNFPNGPVISSEFIVFEGGPVVVTDAAGRFQTPRELNPVREYAAFASASDLRSSRTLWVMGHFRSFLDMTLHPDAQTAPR